MKEEDWDMTQEMKKSCTSRAQGGTMTISMIFIKCVPEGMRMQESHFLKMCSLAHGLAIVFFTEIPVHASSGVGKNGLHVIHSAILMRQVICVLPYVYSENGNKLEANWALCVAPIDD